MWKLTHILHQRQFRGPFSQLERWDGCPESTLQAGNISPPSKHLSNYWSTGSSALFKQDYFLLKMATKVSDLGEGKAILMEAQET